MMDIGRDREMTATWLKDYALVFCRQLLLWSFSFLRSMDTEDTPELSAYYILGSAS